MLEHARSLGCLLEFGDPTAMGVRGLMLAGGLGDGEVSADFVTAVGVPPTGQGRGPWPPPLRGNRTWPLRCPRPFRAVPRQPLTVLWSRAPLHLGSSVYSHSALSRSPPGFQKEPREKKKKKDQLLFYITDSRKNMLKFFWKVILFFKKEVEKFYSLFKFKNRDHTNDDS